MPVPPKKPNTPDVNALSKLGNSFSTSVQQFKKENKYDEGLLPGVDQNEQRAARQTTGDKFKNGLVKMGGTAVTSFLEPFVDMTIGAGTAAFGGGDLGERARGTYDNVGTQTLDSMNDYLQKQYPNYASQKEQNMGLLEGAMTANFWADKVGNGLGFMLGAVASGALTGGAADAIKAGRLAKGIATAAELAGDVSKGAKEGEAIVGAMGKAAGFGLKRGAGEGFLANKLGNIGRAVTSASSKQVMTNFAVGMVGAMGESGMEARQIAHDTGISTRKQLMADIGLNPEDYENHTFTNVQEAHIKDLEEAAGNTGFLYNMALVGGTHLLLLPKIFRKGYQAERVAADALKRSAETGLYEAAELTGKQKFLKTAGRVLAGNAEEATQEQLQFALEKALPDYYRKQRDPEAQGDFNEYLSSMGQGMVQAYGTKEGWENALLGGIIGMAGAYTSLGEVSAEQKATQAAATTINAAISTKAHLAQAKALVAQNAYARAGTAATLDNDQRKAEDAAFGGFASMVRGFSQAGKFEDLIEDLQKTGTLLPEEYKDQIGLAPDAELNGTPASIAAKQVEKAKALHRLSQEIEGAYPGEGNEGARDLFFGIAAQSQNNKNRERKLSNEVAAVAGISYDALVLADKATANEKYTAAIQQWAQDPAVLPTKSREMQQKAADLVSLAAERVQLADQYRALEDPDYRQKVMAEHQALMAQLQAKIAERKAAEAAQKAKEAAAPKPAVAPTPAPAPAPGATAGLAGDTAAGDGYSDSLFGPGAGAPQAVNGPATGSAAPTPGVTHRITLETADGVAEALSVEVDSNGTPVSMHPLNDNGEPDAGRASYNAQKVAALAAKHQATIAAKFAALGIVPATSNQQIPTFAAAGVTASVADREEGKANEARIAAVLHSLPVNTVIRSATNDDFYVVEENYVESRGTKITIIAPYGKNEDGKLIKGELQIAQTKADGKSSSEFNPNQSYTSTDGSRGLDSYEPTTELFDEQAQDIYIESKKTGKLIKLGTKAQRQVIAKLEGLKAKAPVLSDDESAYINGEGEFGRATSLKKSLLDPRSQLTKEQLKDEQKFFDEHPQYSDRGNVVDLITRDFFLKDGVLSLADCKALTDEYAQKVLTNKRRIALDTQDMWQRVEFKDSFYQDVLKNLAILKKTTDGAGWVILSDVPTLHGIIDGKKVAGTMDLVAVNQAGEVFIVDLKTQEGDRLFDYTLPDVGRGTAISYGKPLTSKYREGDLIQQAVYAELLEQRIPGLKVMGKGIFPMNTNAAPGKNTKAVYSTAVMEVSNQAAIDKAVAAGEEAVTPNHAIRLADQLTVGQPGDQTLIGKMSINELIKYYTGKDAASTPTPPKGGDFRSNFQLTGIGDNKAKLVLKPGTTLEALLQSHPAEMAENFDVASGENLEIASDAIFVEANGNWQLESKGRIAPKAASKATPTAVATKFSKALSEGAIQITKNGPLFWNISKTRVPHKEGSFNLLYTPFYDALKQHAQELLQKQQGVFGLSDKQVAEKFVADGLTRPPIGDAYTNSLMGTPGSGGFSSKWGADPELDKQKEEFYIHDWSVVRDTERYNAVVSLMKEMLPPAAYEISELRDQRNGLLPDEPGQLGSLQKNPVLAAKLLAVVDGLIANITSPANRAAAVALIKSVNPKLNNATPNQEHILRLLQRVLDSTDSLSAEATPADLLEQLNTRISASEDLSISPGYQAWKAAVLSGTHTGAYELVWDGGTQYNVTTTVNGKEVKLGYLKGYRAVNAAKSTSAEFNARIEATIVFKAAIAAKYKKGDRIPLRMAIAAMNPDNLVDENGKQVPVTVDSPTLAGMDSRYQYEGAWHVVEWRKPYKMTELFTPILGQFSDEDRRVIKDAGKKKGTDGYLVKVPMPGSILGYMWVGLNTLPVDGGAYGAIYDALLAGKAGTATALANAYFAATTQRDGTHLKFYDDNIVLLSNDEDNTTLNTLRPIKDAARPTDLASFKAAFKAEQGDAGSVLNYVGHQVSKDMAQDAILPLLVPNTSQQLWQTFTVTPVGVAASGVAEPLVVLSPSQEKTAPEPLPVSELFQNAEQGQKLRKEDAQTSKPGLRPLEEREADMDLWPDEELEDFFERQALQPTKKFGDDDSDYYIRPVDAARGDAASRLRPANWKKISKRLAAILPAGISLRRMEELATRLALSGREIGAFWKDAVYLADNLLKGVEYHEAFHALMATVFTTEEYAKATRLGKSRTDLSKTAVAQFLADYPEYAGRSLDSVKHQMVKETLANSFQDFMNNKPGILARLFQKLTEWLGLAQQHQDELLDLFAEIDRGGFKHRKVRLSAEAPEFKSLPNAQVAQSQKIVDLFVVRLWNKVNASGLPADKKEQWEPLLEELIRERMLEDAVSLAGVSSESMEQQHLAGLTAEQRKSMGGSLRSLYRKVYIAPESITAIKQQVGQAWALIKRSVQQPAAEDSLATVEPTQGVDTSSTDDMAERLGNNGSIMDVDTIGNMDEAVKLFIRYTTVGEGKSEQVIEFAPTVGMMFRNLENLRTLDAMRARLREIVSEEGNPQLAAVVARLEAAFMGPNGEVFGNRFRGAFYKSFLDSDDVKVNKAGGGVKLYDSDGEGISKRRIREFNTAFTDYEGDRKAGLATLKDAVDSLRSTPDDKAIAAFEQALAVIGLDLHPGFIRNVAKGRNAQYALDSKNGGKRSLLDDVLQLAQLASTNKNPYETTAGEDGEEATGGGLARAAQLAKADALWQPGLVNSSFTGADGKPKYPFVAPSEVLERSRDIADGTVTFTSAEDALNPLVQMEQQAPGTLAKLRLRNYGGVSEENSEGQAFNALDPKSYLVGALALYRKGKLQLTQFEAKSTNLLFNRPSNARLTAEDGSIKEAAMGYLRSFYQQDLVVNQQVQQRLDDIAAIDVSKPGGQEARYQALMGLEKNHDYKDLGPDNLPVLTSKEQVEAAYALPEGADRDKAISSLPRGLQLVQLPGVNSLTMAERQDHALVDSAIQAELAGAEAAFYELLADNELAIDNKESLALLTGGQKLDTYDGKLQNYLREFLLQDFIYRNSYSQLLRGNESHFKDALDITKRAAGLLAAGPNAGEGHYNMAVLASDYSYQTEDLAHVELPADVLALRATDSKKFKQYLKDNKLHENDDTDASGHILDTRHLDLHRRLGKLTPRAEKEMLALIAGEENVNWDPEASGWNAISWKNVVYGANSPYVKTAGTPLFVQGCGVSMGKNFTPAEGQRAYVSPSGNVWVADVKAERLFNLFMQMKEQGIDEVYHDTAIKKGLKGQNFREGAEGMHGVNGVLYSQRIANADWRQQQENPSGKQKVIDGTQMLQLLDANMDGGMSVTYGGLTQTVAQWRKNFQTAKAAIRKSDEDKAFNLLDAYVNGNPLFQQAVVSALEASGADQNTLDFFASAKDGSRHSMDLAHLNAKFQQIFLAHFNKNVFSQKVPGNKATHIPDSMRQLVIDKAGNLAHDYSKADKDQVYLDQYGRLKKDAGYTVRPLRMHTAIKDSEGVVTGIEYAEVIISEEFLVQNKITKEQLYSNTMPAAVRDKLLTMLGYRIPTQAHHSMLPFKVVGWLPAYYGSVVVTPGGITYLSGTDFDVDSLFIMRHAFSYDKKQGLHIYEGEATPAARFTEYLKYEENNNKAYKAAKGILLDDNAEYQVIKARFAELKAFIKQQVPVTEDAAFIDQLTEDIAEAQREGREQDYIDGLKDSRLQLHEDIHYNKKVMESAVALRQKMQALETAASEQALTVLGQASSLEEFALLPEAEQQSNYVRQNQALTASMALLMNPANWDAMKKPASTERGNKTIDQLDVYSGRAKRSVLPYNHLATQFSHWLANVTGKDNLGIVALTNTATAFATKAGLQLDSSIYFFGANLSGFASLEEQDLIFEMDKDGRMMAYEAEPSGKQDTTSLHVSQMADNVKEQAAARGNLSEEIIPQAGVAGGMGAGYNRTELMTFQPVMWELSRRVAGLKNNWGQKKKTSNSVLGDLRAEIKGQLETYALSSGMSAAEKEDFIVRYANWQPTAQQALDALPFRLPKKGAALSAEDVQHLNTQLYTLRVYGQLQGVQEALGHVSTTLGLTKGVGGSLQDLDRKQASVNYATGKLTQLNINDALETELLLAQNLNTLNRLQNVLGGNFLLRIRQVRERLLALRENSRTAGKQFYGMKEKDFANMELEYLSFLTINAFQQDFKQRYEGYTLASFQGLLDSETTNIVARTQQLLGAKAEDGVTDKYPGLRQNPLLRALTRVKPGPGNLYYGMSYNSRTKSESDYLEKQTDAFVELLSHPAKEVADYANALIMYLAVKNNFQFRSGSFIKVLPALKLEKTSQLLKQVKLALQRGDSAAVKALTGYGDSEGFRQFSRHYFAHPETRELAAQLPRLEDAKLDAKLRKDSTAGLVVLDTDNLSEEEQTAMQDAGWNWDKKAGWAFPDFYADEDYDTKDTIIYEKVGERRDNGQAYRATYRVLQPNYKAKQQTPYHLSPEAAINANAKPLPLDLEQEETGTSARVSRNGQTATPVTYDPTGDPDMALPAAPAGPQQSFTFPDGTVISTGELTLNGQQQAALTKMATYVMSGTATAMTLQGYAGTGKTTITKFFLAWLNKKELDVEMSTPTHRAKAVLEKLSGREVMTMHKMLGLRADVTLEELNMNDLKFNREGEVMIPVGGVVIIDEASMVNDALYGALIEAAKQQQARVIFIGDIGQIKPINQVHVSKVFELDKAELTEVMRQKGGNPLGPILDLIRSDQNSATDLFPHQTQLNAQGEGVIFSSSRAKQRLWVEEQFSSDEFAKDKNHVRVLAGTNDMMQAYNVAIREVIYGKQMAEEHEYLPGELLTGYANWNQQRDKKSLITNSVDYEVVSIRPKNMTLAGVATTGWNMTTRVVGEKIKTQNFYMLAQQTPNSVFKALHDHSEMLRQIALNTQDKRAKSMAWVQYYEFLRSFAMPRIYEESGRNRKTGLPEMQTKLKKTLDYGYAITTHKSQGGTFTKALVLEDDIDEAFFRDNQLRNEIKYVAFSRVSEQLFVVSKKAEAADAPAPAPAATALPQLQMQPDNVAKILSGQKTATSRTFRVADGQYQLPGGAEVTVSNGFKYENISQMKNAEAWAKAEGFQSLVDMQANAKYQHTKDFIAGKGSLWIYQVKPVQTASAAPAAAASTAAPTDQQNEDISDLNDDFMPMGTAVNNPLEYWAAMKQSDTARVLYEDTPYVEQTQAVLERRFGAGVTSNGTAIGLEKAFVFLDECGSALSKSLSTTLQSAVQAINPLLTMTSTTRKGGTLPHGGVTLGWYNPGDNTLGLNLEYTAKQDPKAARGQLVETLNHELLHAVTYVAVEQDPAFRQQILDLMARVQAASPASVETYAMSSPHEFITAVFTDPNFQGLLATIPGNRVNTTVWEEFVKALKVLLAKYAGTVDNNLLEESVALISSQINELAATSAAMADEQLAEADYNFLHQPAARNTVPSAVQQAFAQASKVNELPAAGQELFHHWTARTLPERHQDSDATKLFFIKQYLADKITQVCFI